MVGIPGTKFTSKLLVNGLASVFLSVDISDMITVKTAEFRLIVIIASSIYQYFLTNISDQVTESYQSLCPKSKFHIRRRENLKSSFLCYLPLSKSSVCYREVSTGTACKFNSNSQFPLFEI